MVSFLQAMELVIDRSDGAGKVSKEMMKKKLRKAQKEGRLKETTSDIEWRKRLCFARLMLGDLTWLDWEFRDPWGVMLWHNPEALGKPLWKGEKGKVLVLGEQGLGDEIMFASCIPDLMKTNEIGITCAPRLMSIFERNFKVPIYDRHEGKERARATELLKDYDYYVGMADLPRYFRRQKSDFSGEPYLKPDESRLAEMEPYRGRTGISWRGRNGYYPLDKFPKGLSLQYDINWDEDPELPHFDVRTDMEGLLACVSVLGKLVCVSTTVAHFAGSVGTKTELIHAPIETARSDNQMNWRWGMGETTRWYKSVLIYKNLEQWQKHHKGE